MNKTQEVAYSLTQQMQSISNRLSQIMCSGEISGDMIKEIKQRFDLCVQDMDKFPKDEE